jgi:pantetheine-phosphate adenylyltransferase
LEKRLSLLKDAVKPFDNVKIFAYDGFACDFCLSVGANLMLRGVRNDKDLQYELDLRRQNLEYKGIDTMILVTDEKHKNVSSTYVREHGHE